MYVFLPQLFIYINYIANRIVSLTSCLTKCLTNCQDIMKIFLVIHIRFYCKSLLSKEIWAYVLGERNLRPMADSMPVKASLSFIISWSLLWFMFIESVMLCNHLTLCLTLLLLPLVFPIIRVFSNEGFFTSSGQSIGASASVLPMNIQDWFLLRLTNLISLLSKGLSRVFSSTTVQKH